MNKFSLPFLIIVLLFLTACQAQTFTLQSPTEAGPIAVTPTSVALSQPVPNDTPRIEPTASATIAPAEPLVVLIDNDEGPITPANFNTFIGFWMVGWVYDPLFVRSPDLEPVPALATEATSSEDGLIWTLKLREDIAWHDGESFNAEDVVFSYQFLTAAGRAPNLAAIKSVVVNNEHEITLTLSQPAPFFLNEGLAGYYILPEHIWKDQEPISGELSQFQGQIGTGAYELVEITPGESYTFKANPDYFRGKALVDTIIAKVVKDRTQQFIQLRTGAAAAVLSSVPPALVSELASNEEIVFARGSDFFNYIFYLNGSRPPFDQAEVRQAIAKAIDAEQLVEIVMLGQGVVLPLSWYHPDLPWATNISRDYDPVTANAMLDQLGLEDSDGDGVREFNGEPAQYEILCDTNNPVEVRSTELIAGMLQEVGIVATPNCLDIDTSVSLIWPNFVAVPDPDYDMAIWGWSSGVQFQRGFIRGMVDGDFGGIGWANLTGSSDDQLDQLLAEYISNPEPERQGELNRLVQERFADALPFIPLMSPGGNFAYRAEIYDHWVYVRGTGIMTNWSFLPPTQ